MAEAIVSAVLEQLTSIAIQEIRQGVRLVGDVKKEVEKLKRNLRAIQVVLVDAEQRQLKETPVRIWLDHLKEASYDMEDVLDEWNTAMMKLQIEGGHENALVPKKKVCFFFRSHCFGINHVVLRHDIALKIKDLNENLIAIAREKDMYNFNVISSNQETERVQSTSLIDVSETYGRVDEKSTLLSRLLCESSKEHKALHIVSIVGMGGIGKTTLAQLAYNDNNVKNNFDLTIWVCVSDPFDELRIAKAILNALNVSAPDSSELQAYTKRICDSIKDKKFLLVLDDVWTEDYKKWEPLHNCLKGILLGSKVLITTRKETVALMMESTDTIPINELSEPDCWSLFKRFAFFGRAPEECKKLEEIGRKIVGKCKGLPLAAKTLGSLLRFKKTKGEWQSILDSDMWKLEEFEKGIFPPLLLSYRDLPYVVKRCFSYCSIFPKDYIIWKEELIKLWMAQGYLELEKNKEMEIVGEEYFNNLATRSFFQEFQKDDDGTIIKCKMHDIVHDFAQFLSENECCTIEVDGVEGPSTNSSLGKVRHSKIIVKEGASFPISICSTQRLRSLLIEYVWSFSCSLPNDVLSNLFGELTYLRALAIVNCEFSFIEIPKEIRKLIHLRNLDLSWSNIEKLPETLCELYNLQTLNLSFCWKLKELPQGIGKLINLRHLINDEAYSLSYMPIGIERLTCLRTLSEFVVSDDGEHNNKACDVECLKDFKHLTGDLTIRGFRNITNVIENKGIEVLKNKNNLISLRLWFDNLMDPNIYFDNGGESGRIYEDDELLLEALKPPPNLEEVSIGTYRANTFPFSWILSLDNLRILNLSNWGNCNHLSPLRALTSLEKLSISFMHDVERMGNEFWGIESDAKSSSMIFFPKLKRLEFYYMPRWEEWEFEITRKDGEEEYMTIMPCLVSLSLSRCDKLKALPDHLLQRTTLQKMEIFGCDILRERYKKETGEDWPKISHIPNIIFKNSIRFSSWGVFNPETLRFEF